ncbi:MAG TPA: hypothetical protein VFO29_09955 [Candidatus Rubrimentiphilum sp.]|nr:hypothetical protein [Candidatus Rubrimentiphilum sp.]
MIAAILAAVVLGAVAALDWYSHVAAGIALGGPVPLASIAPRPSPQHAAPPVQTSEPSPPAAQPSAAPSAAGTRVRPSAAPKIVAVSLSTPVATGGQIVTGTVTTSADVTRVQASIAGYSSPLTKVSEGYFALSYRVPELPPVLRRTYTITIVAANAKGQSVSSSLPITIR